VIVSQANDPGFPERMLLRALLLSLLLHFLFFGLWKVGQTQGWWNNLALPRWMQLVSKALVPVVPKKLFLPPPATPTMFVQTDPELASPQPPKEAKFYGANNTLAANKEIQTPSTVPNIEGRQDKVVKTTDNAPRKAVPLQPTPAPPPQPQPVASQSPPKKTYTPGDLAMVAPAKEVQEKDGKSDADATPQPQPAYQRPRTLAEAMSRSGTLGDPMRQKGGVNNLQLKSALDVRGSPIGAYDELFVEAVKTRWFQLLANRTANAPGKVVVEFRMHPDGRITDCKVAQNEVTELLCIICQQAIMDPTFPPWPQEMRREIPADFRDVQFTFFYDLE